MNCVPGMITEFSFTPTVTTLDMRENDDIKDKVKRINKIRSDKSKDLIAKNEEALETYTFDYMLLCNKICGINHYNMQMKIVVETEEEYNAWISQQATLAQTLKQ